MPTTTRFAVAVHILTALAENAGAPVRSEQIAESASTNPVVIRSLLSRLAAAGLTTAQLGPKGGALLRRPAEEISLLDVYRAVEQPELFAMHRSQPDRSCHVGRNIQPVLRAATAKAEQALQAELGRTSIAEIAARVRHRAGIAA
jgi:Rrf2 family protein